MPSLVCSLGETCLTFLSHIFEYPTYSVSSKMSSLQYTHLYRSIQFVLAVAGQTVVQVA